jgi:Tfp pilus assembly protein FimT
MTIVVIAVFAVRPTLGGAVRAAQERAAVRRLVGLLNYSRTDAVARGRLVRVVCAPEEGAFWAEAQVDPWADRSDFQLLKVLGREQVLLPEEMLIAELSVGGQDATALSQSEIYFYPDGRTEGAVLVLLNGAGNEVILELYAATGRAIISA